MSNALHDKAPIGSTTGDQTLSNPVKSREYWDVGRASNAVGILGFIATVIYKQSHGHQVELTTLVTSTWAIMAIPSLIIYLFYMVCCPEKAARMREVSQYITIAALIILYLTYQEIQKSVFSPAMPPKSLPIIEG